MTGKEELALCKRPHWCSIQRYDLQFDLDRKVKELSPYHYLAWLPNDTPGLSRTDNA